MSLEYANEFNLCFWAKKRKVDELFFWLPLKQHLLDTMNVSGLLWEHWLDDGLREFIIDSIGEEEDDELTAKELVRFLGAIHDWGKATPAFQLKKSTYINSEDLDEKLIFKLEKEGFKDLGSLSLNSANESPHALASQVLFNLYGGRDDIGSIIGAHHGKPINDKRDFLYQIASYTANYYQVEQKDNLIYKKWEKEQKNILDWALKETGFDSVKSLPKIEYSAQVVLSGLLIMADWIASNEDFFPLFNLDENGENLNQNDRIRNGWSNWFKTFAWSPSEVFSINDLYKKRFGFEPRELQFKLSEIVKESIKPGIFIIEAPMGVGKTEAALSATEQLAKKMGKSGLFFGLPTQATSDGIFGRIKEWLDNITDSPGEKKSLQLVHGKASLNEKFSTISSNIDIDGDKGVIVNQWFSGKKTRILDDFVVGTVDHFLLTALKQKHLALRHLGLSKKVIVIDEVHAYDAYMSQYLYRAISWMASYKVPIIILSATLPKDKRKELIENYIYGLGKNPKKMNSYKDWDKSDAYPLITYFDKDSIKQYDKFEDRESKEVNIIRISDEDLVDVLKEKLSKGGIAGIIVNTVKRAQNLTKELQFSFGKENVDLLHSNFLSTDRIKKEKDLLEIIGKNVKRPFKRIVVGTQVIEQSLDIDFDILITDLAPMDLLIQRIGRLHRHKIENRPEKLKEACCYVLGTSETFEFNSGSSFVYGDFLLARTQYYLPEVIKLPEDISVLVQKVYIDIKEPIEKDELLCDIPEELQEKYKIKRNEFKELINNKRIKASSYLLGEPDDFDNIGLIGWLNNLSLNIDEKAIAQVRDSTDNIEVIVIKKCNDGYSFLDEFEDISSRINEFNIGKKLATQTLKLPNILSKSYNINKTIDDLEKYNNIYLSKWRESHWLKGALGIILDENNSYELNGWKLVYDKKHGLKYGKVEDNE